MGNTNSRKKVSLARSLFLGHLDYFFSRFFLSRSEFNFPGRTSQRMELQFLNLLAFVLSIVVASAVAAERGSSSRRLEDSPDVNREAGVPKGCQEKCRSIPIDRLKAGCEETCKVGKGDWTWPSKGAVKCALASRCDLLRAPQKIKR